MRLRMSIAKRIDLDQQEGTLNEDDAFELLRTLCNRVNPFRRPTLREVNMSPRLAWPTTASRWPSGRKSASSRTRVRARTRAKQCKAVAGSSKQSTRTL